MFLGEAGMSTVQTDIQINHTQCDVDGQLRWIQNRGAASSCELDQHTQHNATAELHSVGEFTHVSVSDDWNPISFFKFLISSLYFPNSVAINRVQRPDLQNRIYQLFLNETPLTERFARAYGNDMIPPRYAGAQWRGYCYHRRLHAVPIVNDGQFGPHARTITAQFYR